LVPSKASSIRKGERKESSCENRYESETRGGDRIGKEAFKKGRREKRGGIKENKRRGPCVTALKWACEEAKGAARGEERERVGRPKWFITCMREKESSSQNREKRGGVGGGVEEMGGGGRRGAGREQAGARLAIESNIKGPKERQHRDLLLGGKERRTMKKKEMRSSLNPIQNKRGKRGLPKSFIYVGQKRSGIVYSTPRNAKSKRSPRGGGPDDRKNIQPSPQPRNKGSRLKGQGGGKNKKTMTSKQMLKEVK